MVVDNGSTDQSLPLLRDEFPEVTVLALRENLGFGPALNRAVAEHPADPLILLNNDAEAEPRFVEALLDSAAEGVQAVAGVMLQERSPGLIDSAGVVADRTLMGFDYLHGEPVEVAAGAPDPLGPTGGAALYDRAAFEAVGGFDERIFLYYEDLDLALRMRAAGARCRLAPGARALHAYSASLGAGSGEKFARTGWSRGYMLRRYGVMSTTARRRAGAGDRGRDQRRPAADGPDGEGAAGTAARLARGRRARSRASSTAAPCSTSPPARPWPCAGGGAADPAAGAG